MSQGVQAGGNVFSGDLITGDRFGADQQTVKRAGDPKVVRSEILASLLDAFIVGVGGDHVPFLALHCTPIGRGRPRKSAGASATRILVAELTLGRRQNPGPTCESLRVTVKNARTWTV